MDTYTLKITAKGEGKISFACKSKSMRTHVSLPFCKKVPRKKNGRSWSRSTRNLLEGQCQWLRQSRLKSVQRFSFHVNGVVNSYLNRDWYYRKRGSASYIMRGVRSVREREIQRERERDAERERERDGSDGSDVTIVALK